MKKGFLFILIFILFFNQLSIFSSDRSDSLDLMKKCEEESKILEISVKNFGEDKDKNDFENSLNLIKTGKIKVAQSKYLDAKKYFNDYLQFQYNTYKVLTERYIKRTELLVDEVAVDLADFITDGEILRNFEAANNYITMAKSFYGQKHYDKGINPCRMGKQKLLDNYKLVGKEVPEKYKIDLFDNAKKIFSK